MFRIRRLTAALLVILFAATLIPQFEVNAASASTVEAQVYNQLVGKMDFNTAAACGIMANIKHESGFNLSGTGDGNTSFGLFQWHKGRKSRLISYCKNKKLNYKTVEGQLSYFEYELKKSYKAVYKYLKSVDNSAGGAYNAGYYFCYNFEIPANRSAKSASRGKLARDTFWKKYSKYNGKQITVTEKESDAKSTSSKVSFTRKLKIKTPRMKGSDVKYMQQCLKKLGYKLDVDGSYGKGMQAIVKKYQKANGIKADGVISSGTWKSIEAKVAAKTAASAAAAKLKITQQPKSVTVKSGDAVNFSVKATGKGLSYQWYFKKNDGKWTLWQKRTSASITLTSNDSWDGMQVKCAVTDSTGKTVESKTVKVTLNVPIRITQQPKSVSINCSDIVTFSVKATGSNLSYKWYVKRADSDAWKEWQGHKTASFSDISCTDWDGMQVRCVITNDSGSKVTSETAKVTLIGEKVAVG